MTTTYSQPQFLALRTLARSYGHGWATEPDMPEEHPCGPECLWTQGLIAELYTAIGKRDRWESWQYGISAPEAAKSYRGPVCHTTGSGRLTWQVADDGLIGLVISRPGPDRGFGPTGAVVLSARVRDGRVEEIRTPDTCDGRIPDVYMVTAWWSDEAGPRAEARHGDELLRALTAVVGRDAALAAIDNARVPRSPIELEAADPLQGFSPDEIIVGADGQTMEQAAAAEAFQADPDGLSPADRRVADRIADMPIVEPAPGWEDRVLDAIRTGQQ